MVFGLVGLQSDKYALYSSFFAVRNTIQNVIFPLNRFRVRVMDVQRIAQNVFIIMVTYTRAPILRVFFFVSFILLSLCIRFQRQRFFSISLQLYLIFSSFHKYLLLYQLCKIFHLLFFYLFILILSFLRSFSFVRFFHLVCSFHTSHSIRKRKEKKSLYFYMANACTDRNAVCVLCINEL